HGHGTAVAGVAAGTGKASKGQIVGIAPGASLLNIKCMSEVGVGTDAGLLAALDYVVNSTNADIISMSIGDDIGDVDSIVSIAADAAVDAGKTVVVAAGNSGPDWYTIGSPAAARKVITVGASDFDGNPTDFSSRGPTSDFRAGPDILAPGDGILCPLAFNSLTERALQTLVNDYILDGYDGNYIGMSGTSFSTPVVSGALALLMQAFPDSKTRPHALKAAIQQSARDMNILPFVQGAGFLNIEASNDLLLQNQLVSNKSQFKISSLNPSDLNFNPLTPQFPGTSLERRISIVTGKPMAFDITNVNSGNCSLEILNNLTTGQIDGYFELVVNLTIPFNVTEGTHSIEIQLSLDDEIFSIKSYIAVNYPKTRILWDLWHDSSGDSLKKSYIGLMNLTKQMKIQIVEHNELIRPETLSDYSGLVLADSELLISPAEIATIQTYIQEGGNLLIAGNTFPLFNLNSYNILLEPYGIQFDNISLYNLEDRGIDQEISSLDVNIDLEDHEIFNSVSALNWTTGTKLSVLENAESLAYLPTGETVIAVSEPGKGKILALGSTTFLNELEFEASTSGKLKFIENAFQWLMNNQTPLFTMETLSRNRYFSPGDVVTVVTLISDDQTETNYLNSLNASVMLPNGTFKELSIIENSNGNYYFDFLLPNSSSTSQGNFTFYLKFANQIVSSLTIRSSLGYPKVVSLSDHASPTPSDDKIAWAEWIETVNVSKVPINGTLFFNAILSDADSTPEDLSATLHLISDPDFTFSKNEILSLDQLTYESIPLTYDDNSGNWTANWFIPSSVSPGFYHYYIEVFDEAENCLVNTTEAVGNFIITSHSPRIDADDSIVGKEHLNYYENEVAIPSYSSGSNLKFEIIGTDSDSDSDSLTCVIAIFHWEIYWVLDIVLESFSLEYVEGKFQGSYSLPSTDQISTNSGYGKIRTENEAFYVLVSLRDNNGNYDQYLAAYSLGSSFSLTPLLPFVAIILVISTLGILYYVQKRRMRRALDKTYYKRHPEVFKSPHLSKPSIRFCFNCGNPIDPPSQQYCTKCGTKLS
ncbi:MAG: S8 family serine peptidase, partial [Candidatus Hodarchaeota archaeon]